MMMRLYGLILAFGLAISTLMPIGTASACVGSCDYKPSVAEQIKPKACTSCD